MSRTITGKVDWGDGGKIKFGNPPCDTRINCINEDITGCMIWTGEHAGMVSVTISAAELAACNDTYYGCVDWTTQTFKILIPDSCCGEVGVTCGWCDSTPKYIDITFANIVNCTGCFWGGGGSIQVSGDIAGTINDTFRLEYSSHCFWEGVFPCNIAVTWWPHSINCSGEYRQYAYSNWRITVSRNPYDKVTVLACFEALGAIVLCGFVRFDAPISSGCVYAAVANGTVCVVALRTIAAVQGTAYIEEVW